MDGNNDFSESVNKCFKLYAPRLQIEKLLHLADCDVNRTTNLNAARRLIKLGDDPVLLREVRMKNKLDDDEDDKRWLDRADERFLQRKRNIESRFHSTSQTSLEFRRVLHRMSGDLYYDCGDLSEAFSSFNQELLSCTMGKQVVHSHVKLILVSLKRGNLEDVLVWVENVRQRDLESIVAAKVTCACALAHMGLGRYNTAAREFLKVDCVLLGDTFNEVILPRDVAVYGGLCALASYDRSEIQQGVLDNHHAWRVLGFAPEIRKIITEFHEGHYAYCLEYLRSIKANLLLDIYVYKHVERLFDQIREKALLEYAQPFASLNMDTMAHEFNISVSDLEKELVALITDNKLKARIDSHSKVLYRRGEVQTFQRVLGMGNESYNDAWQMMLRLNLRKHGSAAREP